MMEREQMTDTKRGTDGMKENETGIKENDKRSSRILKDQLEIWCDRKRWEAKTVTQNSQKWERRRSMSFLLNSVSDVSFLSQLSELPNLNWFILPRNYSVNSICKNIESNHLDPGKSQAHFSTCIWKQRDYFQTGTEKRRLAWESCKTSEWKFF